MSSPHSNPTRRTLTRILQDVTALAARLRGKLTRRAMTRVTGGVAVGAALVAAVVATSALPEDGASRPGVAVAAGAATDQDTSGGFLAAEHHAGRFARPMTKVKEAPAKPQHARVKAEEVIKLAEEQVGIAETNGRGGGTKFQDWYVTTDRARQTMQRDGGGSTREYKDAAWCVMFLSWIGDQLDFNGEIGSDAWTITHAQWFKDKGSWGATPKPGAVVYFDWDGGSSDIDAIDHVGLVTKVNSDGTFDTVEGNISDAVVSKVRSTGSVVGFGYPDYAK